MKKKLVVISILMLLISTATILPVTSSSTKSILTNSFKNIKTPSKQISISDRNEIELLYEQMKNKIYNNCDPSEEITELISHPELKNILQEISDEETFSTIEVLFSDKNWIIKRLKLIQYSNVLEEKKQNENFQIFKNEFNSIIASDISSLEDIEQLDVIQRYNVTYGNIETFYSYWEEYLNDNSRIKSILQSSEFDPLIFFAIFFVWLLIYTFTFNGLVTAFYNEMLCIYYPLIIGMLEAFVIGVIGGAFLFDQFQFSILGNLSFVEWITNNIIYKLFPQLEIWDKAIQEIVSSTLAILCLGIYILIFDMSDLIQFFGGGFFSISIPLLLSVITYFIIPESPQGMALDANDI